jgi:uncharacterized membrane protein
MRALRPLDDTEEKSSSRPWVCYAWPVDFNGTFYKILLVLHILAVIGAFGPLFLYGRVARTGSTAEMARFHMRSAFPPLVFIFVFGMGLIGLSDGNYSFGQTWIILSFLIWAVLVAVSWFMVRPALRDESDRARSRLAAGIGITHLGMVVAVALMVFRPGL